ncbi:MAG: cyclic nucleotide-binding domain-containing protein [Ilumatobacteraceae bacterium]
MAHAYHKHLVGIPLFADLDEDELDAVAAITTELNFSAGTALMNEGSGAHEMVVVVEGTLEVTRAGEHVANIGPGGFAGEMPVLNHPRREATVTAKTDIKALHLDGRAFGDLIQQVPSVAAKMLPIVASRVVENSTHHQH